MSDRENARQLMDDTDFDRDLTAWIDGELPPERARRVEEAVRADPELASRVAAIRSLDDRIKASVGHAPDAKETVRRLLAKTRPAGRLTFMSNSGVRAAAAGLLLVVGGMWYFCVPPFECSSMKALGTAASAGTSTKPGPVAEQRASRYALPHEVAGAVAAPPAASLDDLPELSSREGVRLDYVRPDGTSFSVIACDARGFEPSFRVRTTRDGRSWWIGDSGARSVVCFLPADATTLYAVIGPAGDPNLFAAAEALRSTMR